MPCNECGESARENGSAGVVFGLRYDEDGEARYICFKCGMKAIKE
ncbi:putative CxxC motif protein [Halorubrum virus Serpecor1]|uniref:Putative CxxC motif protein n=1 Tax=Halorubrum virus Serpecor1 TaxID=2721757 RepID=A0A6G9RWA2_9CAUD|nr:putative CxxC motif protein [Halorubrum virus Serpecor1]QIR31259.1 putative CxxC motif protein [Halorubrum virus Serpecor1]